MQFNTNMHMIQWIKTDMLQLKLFWKSFIQQMLFY